MELTCVVIVASTAKLDKILTCFRNLENANKNCQQIF